MTEEKFCMIENKKIKFRFIGKSKKGAAYWAKEMFKRIGKNRPESNIGILLSIYGKDNFTAVDLTESCEIEELSEKYKACRNSHYEYLTDTLKEKIIEYVIKNNILCDKCKKPRNKDNVFIGSTNNFYPKCKNCRRGTVGNIETDSTTSNDKNVEEVTSIEEKKETLLDILTPSKISLKNNLFSYLESDILFEIKYTGLEELCICLSDKLALLIKMIEAHFGLFSSLIYDKKLEKFTIKPIVTDEEFQRFSLKGKKYTIKFLLKLDGIDKERKLIFTVPNIIELSCKKAC